MKFWGRAATGWEGVFEAPSQSEARSRLQPGDAFEELVPADQLLVCQTCPFRVLCFQSSWDPANLESQESTTVSTCPTCLNKCFDVLGSEDPERRIVPEACPRWNPQFGSALNCDGCRADQDALQRAHPAFEARQKSAMVFVEALRAPDEFTQKRLIREATSSMVESIVPLTVLTVAQMDEQAIHLAEEFLRRVQGDMMRRFALRKGLLGRTETQVALDESRALEGLSLAFTRHSDAGAVMHEWMLVFTDLSPPVRRGWLDTPLHERQLVRKVWLGFAQDLFTALATGRAGGHSLPTICPDR